MLTILSPRGKITRYIPGGVGFQPTDVQMALNEAKEGRANATRRTTMSSAPGGNKLLSFCFSIDPASQKYVPNVNRIAAIVILLFVAIFLSVLVFGKRKTAPMHKETVKETLDEQ